MTYCVGLLVSEGMVLLSDTRTNAGLDDIACYRKMFIFEEKRPEFGEKVIVILTAGNLSVTQNVITQLNEALDANSNSEIPNILEIPTLFQVATVVGKLLSDTIFQLDSKMARMNQTASASMILAGQRKGGDMRLFHIYGEGNFIESSDEKPFLQIGEHKYGKPILDRVITKKTSLEDAEKALLLSMDSTLRSNLSVGMPLDLVVIRKDDCRVTKYERIEAGDENFKALSDGWSDALKQGFQTLPLSSKRAK